MCSKDDKIRTDLLVTLRPRKYAKWSYPPNHYCSLAILLDLTKKYLVLHTGNVSACYDHVHMIFQDVPVSEYFCSTKDIKKWNWLNVTLI